MKKVTTQPDFAMREVSRINRELDLYPRLTSFNRLCAISDRIAWLHRFKKAPAPIIDALITKITAIFDGSWYGDESAETVIKQYING